MKLPILLTLLAFSACAVETVNPPEPAGTVFSGDTAAFGGSDTSPTSGGNDNGNQVQAGFRAAIESGSGTPIEISTGGANTFALYTEPVLTFTPSVFGGNEFHNFTMVVNAAVGQAARQYSLVPVQGLTDLNKAGFGYTQGTTGSTSTMTNFQGTLSIHALTTTKLVGELNVSGQVDGEATTVTAEFSVPVQQQ